MLVEVHLLHQSQPVVRMGVRNAYTKDGLYCVMFADGVVEKYPVLHLFRTVERPEPGPEGEGSG